MSTVKTIVIGTSLTAESDDVVRAGAALARLTGASVRLVHALTRLPVYSGLPVELPAAVPRGGRERGLYDRLEQQARRTGLADLADARPEHRILADALPYQALIETAAETAADLIVVGASEHRWRPLSSTADRVLRKASCPVLAVRHGSTFPPQRALLPVDLSPVSALALRWGVDFLAQLGVAALAEVLFVLNPLEAEGSLQFTPAQMSGFAADELTRFIKANVPEASDFIGRKVRTGFSLEEIVQELKDWQADLVVLGTHGHGRLDRLLIGSVTSDVLREARCNVLVVPPAPALPHDFQKTTAGVGWSYGADDVINPESLA